MNRNLFTLLGAAMTAGMIAVSAPSSAGVIFTTADFTLYETGPETKTFLGVDATGYTNLQLTFKTEGQGTVDSPCGTNALQDCLKVYADANPLHSGDGLDVETFETAHALAVGISDDDFDLTFEWDATGWDESVVISMVQITGDEIFQDQDETSVPEPATLVMFGLGLVGLGLTRRRRMA